MTPIYMVQHLGRGRLLALLVALGVSAVATTANAVDGIYWSAEGAGQIRRGNLDGSGTAATLFGSEASPCGVAIDPAAGKIYWANFSSGGVRVANLDGTGTAATLFDGGASLCGVTINPATNKMYWADFGNDKIRVGNLDGSGSAADLFPTGDAPSGVAIDPAAGKIYWTDQFADIVEVANLDGSGSPAPLFGPSVDDDNPIGVAIDVAAGKIYWTALSSGKIRVGNQDGSGSPSTLFGSEASPGGVSIDAGAGKIYWDSFSGSIRVGNLDGSGTPMTLFGSEGSPLFNALLRAPVGTGVPTITGGPTIGDELTCSQGSWASDLLGAFLYRAPRTFAYQWQKDSIDIGGETATTFTPTEPGSYTCVVTATNQAGSTAQTSAPKVVSAPTATATATATRTATATVTQTATATQTATSTGANTATQTSTATVTGTPTATVTSTPTATPTATGMAGATCAATPLAGCRTPGKAKFYVKDQSKLKWLWLKGDTSFSELGNPVDGASNYRLCVYDEVGGVPTLKFGAAAPAGGMCGTKACWKQLGSLNPKGFKYKDAELTPNGLALVLLKAGDPGKAKIVVKGKGSNLPPAASFTQDTDVTVQLVKSDGGVCWQSVFAEPARTNVGGQFKDQSP